MNNTSFSTQVPNLQLAIDSTSLGEFKTCPRKYYYRLIEGYSPRTESVHLTFGILLHRARETYDRLRFNGASHDDALDQVIDSALRATWIKSIGRPWLSNHQLKTRQSLLRTIVWYLDQFGREDPVETLRLAKGAPAVELSFQFDSGYRTRDGEAWELCGHLDRIGILADEPHIVDIKTTSHSLDPHWFESFTPDNQFSLYALAGKVAFGLPVRSIVVDGCQIGAGFTRFQRGMVSRDEAMVEEWLGGLGYWLDSIERCARDGTWPMNDRSCSMYGGCPFRSVCSHSPVSRERWLEAGFIVSIWDPRVKRGDV